MLKGDTESHLNITANKLAIWEANTGFKGNVTISDVGTLSLHDAQAVGNAGNITFLADQSRTLTDTSNRGTLELSHRVLKNDNDAIPGEFHRSLIGNGLVTIKDLSNNNDYKTYISMLDDNTQFAGDYVIEKNSTMRVSSQKNLGSTDLKVNLHKTGAIEFYNQIADGNWLIENSLTGEGDLIKAGTGTIELNEVSAAYTGKTYINEGKIIAGQLGEGKDLTLNSHEMIISDKGIFNGVGAIKGSVINSGEFHLGDKSSPTPIDHKSQTYTVHGNFTNKTGGTIFLSARENLNSDEEEKATGNVGNQLIVKGHYVSAGGAIVMNTMLNAGHDETLTDQLVVEKNVAVDEGGPTQLFVQYAGGEPTFTDGSPNAIKVVDVGGISANNAFVLGAPVALGVYEYTLHKGYDDESWYLDAFTPTKDITYNPQIGAYQANMIAAMSLFNNRLYDRMSNADYATNIISGENNHSVWGRVVASHQRYNTETNLNIKGDSYLFQVGGDLLSFNSIDQSSIRLGLMAAYGNTDFTSKSPRTGTSLKAKIKSAYSVGAYGTWYHPEGHYIDVWAQYAKFNNEIEQTFGGNSKYKSHQWALSAEGGYTFNAYSFGNGRMMTVQPQGQLIYSQLNNKAYKDYISGISTPKNKFNNLQIRAGVRFAYAYVDPQSDAIKPFAEINWIHNTMGGNVTFNNVNSFTTDPAKNLFEIKVGIEGQINARTAAWGNISYETGKNNYSGYKATAGIKHDF